MTETYIGEQKFFAFAGQKPPKDGSLRSISGIVEEHAGTPMTRRAVAAWETPMEELTCEQVRLLVSQQMGLKWLVPSVTAFVLKHPNALVTFYPGDLTLGVLKSFDTFLTIYPGGARLVAALDFAWLTSSPDADPELARKASELVDNARRLARQN